MAGLPTGTLSDRARAALWGLFVGDALAMPVHWYYDLRQLERDFPHGIQEYEKPPVKLPGSILNLSNTGGGGRGSDKGHIIGNVINHGKRKFWLHGGTYHYHATLQRGENTLEGQLARVLMKSTVKQGGYFRRMPWLQAFEAFMTSPGSHNDVYASTYIRMFFKNRVAGKPLDQCADNDQHNVDAIDALTLLPPVILSAHLRQPDDRGSVQEAVTAYLSSTRRSRRLPEMGMVYARLFLHVLGRSESTSPADALREAAIGAAQEVRVDLPAILERHRDRDPMTACYIDSSFPALLVFIYKYAEEPARALLASANAGGENVARGSALGAVMGAAYGMAGWPQWCIRGLHSSEKLAAEIDLFLAAVTSAKDT